MATVFRWLHSPRSLLSRFTSNSEEKPAPPPTYEPTVSDVLMVKRLILHVSELPLELVDLIIDYAEYWPHTTTPALLEFIRAYANGDENKMIVRSLPLGYVPSETSPDYQIMSDSEEQKQLYFFKEPLPLPDNLEIPNDATEEVLQHWLSKSRPRTEHPCRKIVFTFTSHDQGWGGEASCRGTYNGAFSWFDVGLERICATRNENLIPHVLKDDDLLRIKDTEERLINCIFRTINPITVTNTRSDRLNRSNLPDQFMHPLIPNEHVLQKNLAATRDDQDYKITLSATDNISPDSPEAEKLEAQGRGKATASGEFVRNLQPGDVVTVWAKARFPGWANHVKSMKIDVYWAV
ncbi:hypothetical protein F5884DRAFT_759280 [Xylogone sp. PMI_703]|nr:hypothetical protein F5884DRAFT_759280 [Xylogone sp. PMI_703]